MSVVTISGESPFVTQPYHSERSLSDDSGIALPIILRHLEPFACFPLLRVCQSWHWTLLTDLDYSMEIPVLRSIADKYHIEQLTYEKESLQGEEKEKIDERIRNASFWIDGEETFLPVPLATWMERKCDFFVQEVCDAYVQIALKKDPYNIGVIVSAMSAHYEKHDPLSSL